MKCQRCGSPLEKGVLFCENCGARQQRPSSACCPRCGARMVPGKSFCEACGARVSAAPAVKRKAPKRTGRKLLFWITAAACVLLLLCGGIVLKRYLDAEKSKAELAAAEALVDSSLAPFLDGDGLLAEDDLEAALRAIYENAAVAVGSGEFSSAEQNDGCVVIGLGSGGYFVYYPQETRSGPPAPAPADEPAPAVPTETPAADQTPADTAAPTATPVQEVGIGGNIATVQPFFTSLQSLYPSANTYPSMAAQRIVSALADYTYANDGSDKDDSHEDQEVSLDFLKHLSSYAVVMWQGYGGYSERLGSFLATTIPYSNRYFGDLISGRIVVFLDGTVGVTAAFFEHYLSNNEQEETVILLAAGESGRDSRLADSFLHKGFDCVIASSGRNRLMTDLATPRRFFGGMSGERGSFMTSGQALQYTWPLTDQLCLYGSTEVCFKRGAEGEEPPDGSVGADTDWLTVYQRYIDEVLIPQYGRSDLDAVSRITQEQASYTSAASGVAGCAVDDLDGDGMPELMVTIATDAVPPFAAEHGYFEGSGDYSRFELHFYTQHNGAVTEIETGLPTYQDYADDLLAEPEDYYLRLRFDPWSEALVCSFESGGETFVLKYRAMADADVSAEYMFYQLVDGKMHKVDVLEVHNNLGNGDYACFSCNHYAMGRIHQRYGGATVFANIQMVDEDYDTAWEAYEDKMDEVLSLYSIRRSVEADSGPGLLFDGASATVLYEEGASLAWFGSTQLVAPASPEVPEVPDVPEVPAVETESCVVKSYHFDNEEGFESADPADNTVAGISYDLNGDGFEEIIDVGNRFHEDTEPEYINGYVSTRAYIVDGYSGKVYVFQLDDVGEWYALDIYILDMDRTDGHLELAISFGASDARLPSYYIGRYKELGTLTQTYLPFHGATNGVVTFSGYSWFFGDAKVYIDYYYNGDGRISKSEVQRYDFARRTRREIPVQWEVNGVYTDGVLPAETEITLVASDRSSYAIFMLPDGRRGRFSITFNGEYTGDEYTIDEIGYFSVNGIPDFDVFYDVEYSG